MTEWLSTLGVAMGSAWLSGINLYATAATLGLLQRFGLVHLPGELGVLSNWWVIGVAAGMYVIEFIADKIPAVDSAWDAVHTFIRVPAGAVMAFAAFSHADPAVRIIALLIGGGVAFSSHGTKAAVRATANLSPEPFEYRSKPGGRRGHDWIELPGSLVSTHNAGDRGAVSSGVFLDDA